MNTERIEHFKKKYGEAIIANGLRLRPDDFLDEVEWRDAVDQHYTKIWLEFTYGGLWIEFAFINCISIYFTKIVVMNISTIRHFEVSTEDPSS